MKKLIIASLLFSSVCAAQSSRPNFLIIVADDVGYSETGPYGSEIDTPALDSLAEEGLMFTSFYAHMNCSPTRSMLLSGTDNHLAGLGTMGAAFASPAQKDVPGYEGVLSQRVLSFAKLMQDEGYRSYTTGKWHLGVTPETLPIARGFDQSFIQAGGGPPSHFNFDPYKPGEKLYPDAKDTGLFWENNTDMTGTPVADDFYSNNFYTDKIIEYMANDPNQEKPFLAYLAFSAPHLPVQTPETHIDLYKGVYDEGYDVLRQQRFENIRQLGLFAEDIKLADRAVTVTPWDELSDEARKIKARRMEVYAGAVDNMDDNISKVIDYLKNTDQYDNTYILFMSDNGAAGFFGWNGGSGAEVYKKHNKNMEMMGRDGSPMIYGPGWASAGSVPFHFFKRHGSEGGIRVPAIITGPGIDAGSMSHRPVVVSDVAPTILELAGIKFPTGIYKEREILPQTGKSFSALFSDQDAMIHGDDEMIGFELWGRMGARKGDWKISWVEEPFREQRWYLHYLKDDPGETADLSHFFPEILDELLADWEVYKDKFNIIPSETVSVFIRPMWLINDSPHPDPMP
jgi:arylsulfatase